MESLPNPIQPESIIPQGASLPNTIISSNHFQQDSTLINKTDQTLISEDQSNNGTELSDLIKELEEEQKRYDDENINTPYYVKGMSRWTTEKIKENNLKIEAKTRMFKMAQSNLKSKFPPRK